MKYKLNKTDTHMPSNAADQIITLEELLFNSKQIRDIKRFCCVNNGQVLGMYKTSNLGEFHVTPTVYKDISVVNRLTGESPICFGPTLIHTNSTTKA
ncbi:hypothetical protein DPMN_121388 [Dreissena polymorpha]|uniref:Uncharacterized protein n=1 Tax=Dreissena polymorpha TaxID=45954 RepID=A0A9D4JT24_DREPO|nr:hypothetical protein DPMN_121388 [Dreissena polymorpha]